MKASVRGIDLDFASALDIMDMSEVSARGVGSLSLVDLVVEFEDRYLFVRVADERGMKSSEACELLARAFRDSMFFHLFGDWRPKRVEYAVLCANGVTDDALVFALQDELRRRLPLTHPTWSVESAFGVSVMTLPMWCRKYGDGAASVAEES